MWLDKTNQFRQHYKYHPPKISSVLLVLVGSVLFFQFSALLTSVLAFPHGLAQIDVASDVENDTKRLKSPLVDITIV